MADDPKIDIGEWFDGLSNSWRTWLAVSDSADEATDALVYENRRDLEDEFLAATFWLAVAYYQWRDGCLSPSVKRRALEIIDNGQGLEGDGDARTRNRRQREYVKLRARLMSPMRRFRPVKKRTLRPSPLALRAGLIVSDDDGPFALLHVCELVRQGWSWAPLCCVFPWAHPDPPKKTALRRMRPVMQSPAERDPVLEEVLNRHGGSLPKRKTPVALEIQLRGKPFEPASDLKVIPRLDAQIRELPLDGRLCAEWSELPARVRELV